MPANSVPQIPLEYLKSRLDYRNNRFYWKPVLTLTSRYKTWNTRFSGKRAGYLSPNGYWNIGIIIGGEKRTFGEHRLIWLWRHGYWPKGEIDHEKGVRDHNWIDDLRDVTHSENLKNQKMRKNNTSGVMGVSWYKRKKKWESYIQIDQKKVRLGYFSDKFDAICARKSAEIKNGYHANHGRTK